MAVGISFGSPTSGAGFDVSSTVSQIVSNLQNVETPWKTKLTDLKSEDTVISSLGKMLSSLSSDLSTLTDVTGIMTEKAGSSSDTGVLELTSATSAAQAGTHTVVVKNLAVSSTGYLNAITNTADTLSGSIVLQVGSGTAKTITLDSTNNTLAGLASAINASGAGVTANVLTDSNGSRLSLVSGTSGTNGTLAVTSTVKDTTTSTDLSYNESAKGKDATLIVDGITMSSASNTVSGLIPGLTFQLLAPSSTQSDNSLEEVQVVIGNNTTGVASAIYSFVTDYNSLVSAMDAQEGTDSSGNAEPLFGSPTLSLLQQQLLGSLNAKNPTGTLTSIASNLNATLSGSVVLQVGTGAAQTITLDSSDNTLDGLASAINAANIGVTASVATKYNTSTLLLTSSQPGSKGALTISSTLTATMDTALSFTDAGYTSTTADSGTFNVNSSSDILSGSVVLKVGSGTAHTISVDSSQNTLAGLAQTINSASIGVTATINEAGTGLTLTSTAGTVGSSGALSVTSNLLDTTATSTTALKYSTSSDILTLSNIGVSVSSNADGSLSLDVATLTSALTSDFSGVSAFFQNANSWGTDFATMLNSAGTSSTTGILNLALTANSSTESHLNANISREENLISAERKSLFAELTSANEILQAIPQQISEINMLYSAITGYNQSS